MTMTDVSIKHFRSSVFCICKTTRMSYDVRKKLISPTIEALKFVYGAVSRRTEH